MFSIEEKKVCKRYFIKMDRKPSIDQIQNNYVIPIYLLRGFVGPSRKSIHIQSARPQKSDFIEIKHKNNVTCHRVYYLITSHKYRQQIHTHTCTANTQTSQHTFSHKRQYIFCWYVMNINAFIHIYIYICMHGKKN